MKGNKSLLLIILKLKDQLFVLDTSAILSRKLNIGQDNFVIPSSVMEEIRLGKIARSMVFHEDSLNVRQPTHSSIIRVREAARETGDISVLSTTDMDVIAVALDIGGTVVSDDFAIENVASKLGLPILGADLSPISKSITWQFSCTGCGKKYTEKVKECNICGHSVKRSVKSYKRR